MSHSQLLYGQSAEYYDPSTSGQVPLQQHDAPYLETEEFTTFFDKVTPDAFITGSSASYTFNPGPLKFIPFLDRLSGSLVCGADVLISLNELPSIFVYGGGGGGKGISSNVTPRSAGLVWELDGHENYRGRYQTLSVDAGAGVGVEANLFRSPGAVPFDNERPGSWGFTAAPNAGGGGSVAYTETCYVEITSMEFIHNLATGDFASILSGCR